MTRGTCHTTETGISLLEMLVALTLFAAASGFAAALVGGGLSGRALDGEADRLMRDLQRFQLSANGGEPVVLSLSSGGYQVLSGSPGLSRAARRWRNGVVAEWQECRQAGCRPRERVTLQAQPAPLDLRVSLRQGEAERIVRLQPLSGQVRRE